MKKIPEPQFTPEQELLLWSIRVDHTRDDRIEEILSDGVDWNYVRETAIKHGIIPLLYKRLKEKMGHLVPPDELSVLRTLFMANAVKNLRMTQQLTKVLDLLANAGIQAMPFKGPALAVQAYGDLSMRSFDDLDILIHEKDFKKTYSILESHGFQPDYLVNSRIECKFLLFQEKDLIFSFKDIYFEIHWKITERFLSIGFIMNQLWINSVPVFLNNKEFKTLSPEDLVIVLSIHGTKHMWQNLKWLADFVQLISNCPELQWQEIFKRAENLNIRRILFFGLYLAQENCNIKYPFNLDNIFISDDNFENSITIIQNNFFNYQTTKWFFTPPSFYLKLRERFRDKTNFFIYSYIDRILLPDYRDFSVISLPDFFFPLYLIIRPFRLLRDFFHRVVQSNNNKTIRD